MKPEDGKKSLFSKLPSVEKLLVSTSCEPVTEKYGRDLTAKAIREVVECVRNDIRSGDEASFPENESAWMDKAGSLLSEWTAPTLKSAINCTGVVVHTNLGRSQLAGEALNAVMEASRAAVNLEYNLSSGCRGERDRHVEDLLIRLTGSEAATVVNNNAAAVLLTLNTLSNGREAIVSRGELIEIGGSFRLPEIMSQSGSVLREVGTTNRTHLHDYESAITGSTGVILKAHTSNYRVVGFTCAPGLKELSGLARKTSVPLLVDLGSGTLTGLDRFGLSTEPTVSATISDGADIVTFSGDKLLGGPQCGIIAGRKDLVDKIRKNHLKRALRCCKLTLAGLSATLRLYLNPADAIDKIPTLRHLSREIDQIKGTATEVSTILKKFFGGAAEIFPIHDISRAGSGALPEVDIKSVSVAIRHKTISPDELADWFRKLDTSILGRIEDDLYRLDMRCIDSPDQIGVIIEGVTPPP